MASRIVTSPAGEQVEIVNDDDWLALTGQTNDHGLRQWNGGKGGKPFVIMELWLGGKVEDRSGRASSVLFDAMHSRFPEFDATNRNSISTMMLSPLNAPAFERIMNAKRTFSLRLIALPERWYRKMLRDLKDRGLGAHWEKVPVTSPPIDPAEFVTVDGIIDQPIDQVNGVAGEGIDIETLAPDIDLDAPTVFDIKPPLELTVAAQVAMSLLTTVVEIISAGSTESTDERVRKLQADLNDIAGKLSLRLSENDTLRRQVRESGDMIIALRTERDGLRSRLKATEHNLQAALKGDAVHAINGEIMRRVDSIMRVAPASPKGGDEA